MKLPPCEGCLVLPRCVARYKTFNEHNESLIDICSTLKEYLGYYTKNKPECEAVDSTEFRSRIRLVERIMGRYDSV